MILYRQKEDWGTLFMKVKDFLSDKLYFILMHICACGLIYMFLNTTGVSSSLISVIIIINFTVFMFSLIVEYARRYFYYKELLNNINALDKKYLICDTIKEPEFIDGKLLYQVLQKTHKSMNDEINMYKNNSLEYKEYIEMWVHEVKTPLAAAKLILHNNTNEKNESVIEEIDKVENFVNQALFYARSNTTEKDYLIKKFMLSSVVSKVVKKHSKLFICKQIKVSLNHLDEEVYSDSKWVEFILDQIISNALKYTDIQGEISISATSSDHKVLLEIKDNGIGIDEDDLPRIFDKGFTGKNGRKYEKATGMGLYLCKKLCDKLYLNITCDSKVNQGCVITIVFPKSEMI